MDITAVLIIFSSAGAWLCARHRAATPGIAFGVLATVLFCSTPLGAQLPSAVAAIAHWTSGVGAHVVAEGTR